MPAGQQARFNLPAACQRLQSAPMLLAIDVGNSNITLGLWDGAAWVRQWRLRTVADKTVDEYGVYLKSLLREAAAAEGVAAAVLASVVPPLTATFLAVCGEYLGCQPLQVTAESDVGIAIKTENPAEVGADRIANAAAAYYLYSGPAIVVDMGTATTFDVVTGRGELAGVAIAPGLGLAAAALAGRAAQLSKVALEAPPQAIGRNTMHAMQSGLIFGYASLVEGMVGRLAAELGPPRPRVIGTGGLIGVIAAETRVIEIVDPWLTLNGLRLIYDRATGRGQVP
ncbi:MAG: type III pantothenate kinase [Candidatus Promineifilaceae bacterium]